MPNLTPKPSGAVLGPVLLLLAGLWFCVGSYFLFFRRGMTVGGLLFAGAGLLCIWKALRRVR